MNKTVELRIRRNGSEAFRLELGTATTRRDHQELLSQRELLRKLHARGERDVLDAVKSGRVTVPEVARLAAEHGLDGYRRHLKALESERHTQTVPTLKAHSDKWLGTLKNQDTRQKYRRCIERLREQVVSGQLIGDRPWHQVPPHTIRDVKDVILKTVSSNTMRTTLGAWSSFYEWAVARERSEAEHEGREPVIQANPVRLADVWDPIEITRHRFLTWEEFQKLVTVAQPAMKAQYATLALMGLRIGELMALPVQHVHLPSHVHIGPWGTWAPKGYPAVKNGVRDIPVHRDLLPLLEHHAAEYAGETRFFVSPATGGPWTKQGFDIFLKRDVTEAGMVFGQWSRKSGPLKRTTEGVTAHTLRHTLASWLAQSDIQLMKIAKILGDTVQTIESHYAHLLPRDLDQAINRVGPE